MATARVCAACGTNITDAMLSSRRAVREGNLVFCQACASLIVEPAEQPPQQKARRESRANAVQGKSASAVRQDAGIQVVEEFVITGSDPAPATAATSDLDELFEHSPGPRARTDTPPRQAPSSRVTSDLRQPPRNVSSKVTGPVRGVKPSGRTGSSRRQPDPEPEPEPPPRPSRRISQRTGPAGSGRGRGVSAEPPEPRAPSGRIKPGSRRMSAAASARSASVSKRTSGRFSQADDEPGRSTRSVARAGKGTSSNTMILIGVGAVVVLLLGVLIVRGTGGDPKKDTKAVVREEDLGDRTPAETWARRAQEKEARGDRLGAADDYEKAGVAAQRDGNTKGGETYNMHAYQLRKFTTLNYSGTRR